MLCVGTECHHELSVLCVGTEMLVVDCVPILPAAKLHEALRLTESTVVVLGLVVTVLPGPLATVVVTARILVVSPSLIALVLVPLSWRRCSMRPSRSNNLVVVQLNMVSLLIGFLSEKTKYRN